MHFKLYKYESRKNFLAGFIFCGAAGNRTPVQTSKPYAFYMLILSLVFVSRLGTDTRTSP